MIEPELSEYFQFVGDVFFDVRVMLERRQQGEISGIRPDRRLRPVGKWITVI